MQGFWRGALARAARVGPGQAILFTMYPIFYGLLDAAWMREAGRSTHYIRIPPNRVCGVLK